MPYEASQRILRAAKCGSARLASIPRLQRTQSPLRKHSPGPSSRLFISLCGYVRSSTGRFTSHGERHRVCYGFGGSYQRDRVKHYVREHGRVASHDHDGCDLRAGNSKCEDQYSERDLRRSRLYERRNQQHSRLDCHLKGRPTKQVRERCETPVGG